ncbi:MAG TPA: hypothetical protein VGV35_05015, partial [Bryobacteraceae bacterium]|nr:hypothetical protein [Bryobacteraceae bacterium]
RKAAPGVDGVTWRQYGEGLEERLRDLHDRIHRGAYRAQPSRRTYGKLRGASGVPTGGGPGVAGGAAASQSTGPAHVGALPLDPRSLPAPAADSASGSGVSF